MSLVQELVQYCQSFEYNQVHQLRTISNKNFGQIYFSFPFNEGLGNTASFQTRTVWSEQASSQSMMEEYTSDVFFNVASFYGLYYSLHICMLYNDNQLHFEYTTY